MKKIIYILPLIVLLLIACIPVKEVVEAPSPIEEPKLETSKEEVIPTEIISDKPFEPLDYEIIEAYPNLEFEQPLYYTNGNDETNIVFVVERTGKIKYFENNSNVESTDIFLDLSNLINISGSEKGLLGLAFHPNFKENGYFFVNYTNRNDTVIARYSIKPNNPNIGDIDSEFVLLSFPQPYDNHNGGQLAFGPDGYLYIATGDGGSSGDPHNNSQNPSNFHGNILRIDVDQPGIDKPYSIPEDNPYVGNKEGILEETYAYGFRNPWRFSFDGKRKILIVADVGQNKLEEINIIEGGSNYGWNIMEGNLNYSPSENVDKEGLKLPIWEYDHTLGKSITGGYVYYGNNNPSLRETYIYGDFISGRIWGLWLDRDLKPHNYELVDTDLMISSFGLDEEGELIIIDFRGKLYKLREIS